MTSIRPVQVGPKDPYVRQIILRRVSQLNSHSVRLLTGSRSARAAIQSMPDERQVFCGQRTFSQTWQPRSAFRVCES